MTEKTRKVITDYVKHYPFADLEEAATKDVSSDKKVEFVYASMSKPPEPHHKLRVLSVFWREDVRWYVVERVTEEGVCPPWVIPVQNTTLWKTWVDVTNECAVIGGTIMHYVPEPHATRCISVFSNPDYRVRLADFNAPVCPERNGFLVERYTG